MIPPEGFGRPGVNWQPDVSHLPSQVAALWAQHKIVLALRQAWPDMSSRELARLAGTHKDRAAAWLNGTKIMTIEEALNCIVSVGLNFATLEVVDWSLLPEEYAPFCPGDAEPGWPRFMAPSAALSIQSALDEALSFWQSEADAGRESVLSSGVLTHKILVGADGKTMPAAAAVVHGPSNPDPAWPVRVSYSGRFPTNLHVLFLPDLLVGDPVRARSSVLRFTLSPSPQGEDKDELKALLLGPVALAQFELHGGVATTGQPLLFRGHDLDETGATANRRYLVSINFRRAGRAAVLLTAGREWDRPPNLSAAARSDWPQECWHKR